MRSWIPPAAVPLLLALAAPAAAWNDVGHMTTAKLAWEELNAARRKAAYQALTHLPHFAKFMAERPRPEGVPEMEWAFLNAATWPDWLRAFTPDGRRPDPAVGKYHHGPWHYINLPIIAPGDADFFKGRDLDPRRRAKGASEENIVTALEAARKTLRDPEAAAADRAVALCWLLHLGGDIHQPLHCVAYFSRKDYPDGDQGGNRRWVKDGGQPINLHAYWDQLPGVAPGFGAAPFARESSAKAYTRVKENYERLTRAAYRRDRFAEDLERTGFMRWVEEGLGLAKTRVYDFRGKPIPGLPIQDYYHLPKAEQQERTAAAPPLPAGYGDRATMTARRRLALAGHRLADQLNAVFPGKP